MDGLPPAKVQRTSRARRLVGGRGKKSRAVGVENIRRERSASPSGEKVNTAEAPVARGAVEPTTSKSSFFRFSASFKSFFLRGDKNMISVFQWTDGREHGGRYPRLYLIKGREARKFEGKDIPGWCVVLKREHHPCGKWSWTEYEIGLEDGTRPIELLSPMHGTFGQEALTWEELAGELQLPVDLTKEIIRAEYPRTGERLDKNEDFLSRAGERHHETLTLVLAHPTCRQMAEGYWRLPKVLKTSWGETVKVAPGKDGWHSPVVEQPGDRAHVAGVRYSPGYHGGKYEIDIVVYK